MKVSLSKTVEKLLIDAGLEGKDNIINQELKMLFMNRINDNRAYINLRLPSDLVAKLESLKQELDLGYVGLTLLALNELYLDRFPLVSEVEGDIPCS